MSSIKRITCALLVTIVTLIPCNAARAQRSHCMQPIDSKAITLPADDMVHTVTPESFEWFYWTSHLEASDGRQFGFLQIVYSAGAELQPGMFSPILYADATVSDLREGKYEYGEREFNYSPSTPAKGFDLVVGETRARGGHGRDSLHAVVNGKDHRYDVDLTLRSTKTPVEELAEDYIREYARTRMQTAGTISVDGVPIEVRGWSVFDHAFGDMQPQLAQVDNWTWISLQLEDGSELLLLKALRLDGSTLEYAILTDAECRVKHFSPRQYTLTPTKTWQMSESCQYPIAWTLSIPAEQLELSIHAAIDDQDIFRSGVDHYYEGEVTASGSGRNPARGRGVVELTWFCSF